MKRMFDLPDVLADMIGAAAISVAMIAVLWLPVLV